jgi:hypothetical protein
MIGIGIPLMIAGFINFFNMVTSSISLSIEDFAKMGVTTFAIFACGIVIMGVGSTILRYGYIGTVSKYVADETGPAISSVSKSIFTGVKEAGGIDLNVPSNEKIMIKCRNCGTLNDEHATYCDNCGSSL